MIPKNIGKKHVIRAIEEIKRVGFPKNRVSKRYLLKHDSRDYPPKYVVSLANKYINGTMLEPSKFEGGSQTNAFLKRLGFEIVGTSAPETPIPSSVKISRKKGSSRPRHSERCPLCKEVVRELFKRVYGRVEQNHKIEIGTHLEDFADTPYYKNLEKVYLALQNARGFKDFIRAKNLPRVDFLAVEAKRIIEFDESQHFTFPRKIALENYPKEFRLGFSRQRWINLCERINIRDDDPPYRDEQRAWYDTLRDYVPMVRGLNPTIRLFAKDHMWCNLDPNSPLSVKRFQGILKGESQEHYEGLR